MEKVFDEVPRFLDNYEDGIKSLYRAVKTELANEETEKCITIQVVQQGRVLSPLQVVLYFNKVIKESSARSTKLEAGYNRLQIANNEKALQNNFTIWTTVLENKGMNIDKTKTIIISNEGTMDNEQKNRERRKHKVAKRNYR